MRDNQQPRKISEATLAIRNRMLSNLQSAYDQKGKSSAARTTKPWEGASSSGKKWNKNVANIQALQELSTNLFGGSTRDIDDEEYGSIRQQPLRQLPDRPLRKEEFVRAHELIHLDAWRSPALRGSSMEISARSAPNANGA